MKAWKTLVLAVCVLGVVTPAFAGIFITDYQATKDTFLGRSSTYGSDSNYGTTRYGEVGNANRDGYIMDFDRVAMLAWINTTVQAQPGGAGITITNLNQIANGALIMNLNVTAYAGAWMETNTPPPTEYGHYYWPAVRLSKGQNWDETTATFNNAASGSPWHDATGAAISNIYTNKYQYLDNTITNAASEQWGDAPNNGRTDIYCEDTVRPWKLDDAVAFAALKNPDVVAFQLLHDYQNKPWASGNGGEDDCNGQVYAREHGSVEFRPYVEVFIDTTKIINQSNTKTYLIGDINQDGYVEAEDFMLLERNFGKSGMWYSGGDYVDRQGHIGGDGWVTFADVFYIELNWVHGPQPFGDLPEPASITLMVLGGMAMLKRRRPS